MGNAKKVFWEGGGASAWVEVVEDEITLGQLLGSKRASEQTEQAA